MGSRNKFTATETGRPGIIQVARRGWTSTQLASSTSGARRSGITAAFWTALLLSCSVAVDLQRDLQRARSRRPRRTPVSLRKGQAGLDLDCTGVVDVRCSSISNHGSVWTALLLSCRVAVDLEEQPGLLLGGDVDRRSDRRSVAAGARRPCADLVLVVPSSSSMSSSGTS